MSDFSYSDIISKEIDRLDSMPPEEYRKSPVVKEIVEQFTEETKPTIRPNNNGTKALSYTCDVLNLILNGSPCIQ